MFQKEKDMLIKYYLLGVNLYEQTDQGIQLSEFGTRVCKNAVEFLTGVLDPDQFTVELLQLREPDKCFKDSAELFRHNLTLLLEADTLALVYPYSYLLSTAERKIASMLHIELCYLPIEVVCDAFTLNESIQARVQAWCDRWQAEIQQYRRMEMSSDSLTRTDAYVSIESTMYEHLCQLYQELRAFSQVDTYVGTCVYDYLNQELISLGLNVSSYAIDQMIYDIWFKEADITGRGVVLTTDINN